ncbi:MAG: radical SAM protein [Archangium sp.]|nr:radical SAM protein [Archangium sp.]
MTRVTLSLGRACNNACVFCSQDALPPSSPLDLATELARLRGTGATELTLVGGEPTLQPALAEVIRLARAQGFERVGLQTNGRLLASLAPALAAAGLTDVHVTVLGGEPAVHDYHTAVEGSFRALVAGLGVARSHGLQVVATTVMTRSNYRVLNAIGPLLQSRGVSAWQVTAPLVAGRAVAAMDRVIPRLALAVPYALHALDAAQRLGLRTFVSGIPSCLLGPFITRALPGAPRAFAPQCAGCPARERCSGVDATYLARFGDDELTPVANALAAPAPLDGIARMFTGPGETFVPENIVVPAPPATARAQLGEMGKGVPATAEVSSKDRKSGEALKGIFPELFKAKDG